MSSQFEPKEEAAKKEESREWKGVDHSKGMVMHPSGRIDSYLSFSRSINIRVDLSTHKYFTDKAREDRRPVGTYIRMILEDMMKKDLIEQGLLEPSKVKDKIY